MKIYRRKLVKIQEDIEKGPPVPKKETHDSISPCLATSILILVSGYYSNLKKALRKEENQKWLKRLTVELNVLIEVSQAVLTQRNGEGKLGTPLYLKLSVVTSCCCLVISIVETIHEWHESKGGRFRRRFYLQGRFSGMVSVCFGIFSSMTQFCINFVALMLNKDVVKFDPSSLLLSFVYLIASMVDPGKKSFVVGTICGSFPFFSLTIPSDVSKLEDYFRQILMHSAVFRDPDLIQHQFGEEKPNMISELRDIAGLLIHAGYEKQCCQVYIHCRRDALGERMRILEIKKPIICEYKSIEGSKLEEMVEKWIQAVKIFSRVLLPEENRLCEQITGGSSVSTKPWFVHTAGPFVIKLLSFGKDMSEKKQMPKKLFTLLDMYEALRDALPHLEVLFSNKSGELVCTQVRNVLDRLGEAAKGAFMEFESDVMVDESRTLIPAGGEFHPYASYVISLARLLVKNYGQTLNSLLDFNVNKAERQKQSGDDTMDMIPLGCRLVSLMNSLKSNLEEKAKFYEENALQAVFLMNVTLYVMQEVKDTELGMVLGYDWIKSRGHIINQYRNKYFRASWGKVLACLRDIGTEDCSSDAFKMAFKYFNASFEEIYKTQTAWKVPDPKLRLELRKSISKNITPVYSSFLERYGSMLESVGNADHEYIKYKPEDLERLFQYLFQGTPWCFPSHDMHKS